MYVKIVDIHQLVQQIIMNILKLFIHIHQFYIDIMIKGNLNLIRIHQYLLKAHRIGRFYQMTIIIFNDNVEIYFFLLRFMYSLLTKTCVCVHCL
jgi:hypothetical protein